MIRIDLLHRRKRRGGLVLAMVAAGLLAIGAGAAGVYWLDRHYPLHRTWEALWGEAPEEPVVGPPVDEFAVEELELVVVAADSGLVPAGEETAGAAPEATASAAPQEERGSPVVQEEMQELATAAPEETQPVGLPADQEAGPGDRAGSREPAMATPASAGGIRPGPAAALAIATDDRVQTGPPPEGRESGVCLRVVKVSRQLPTSVQLTALTCKASGEYSLEGVSPSSREVEDFLETLQRLPSRATLSWWREGRPRPDQLTPFQFTFHGQLEKLGQREPAAMSAVQGQGLREQVAAWARQNGLEGVSFDPPIEAALGDGRPLPRQKVWATGSYAQVGDFLQQLAPVEATATLDEVVIVPVSQEEVHRDQARLYMALDLVGLRP